MSYRRKREDERRLKRLYDKTKHHYGAGVYFDKDKNRYIRYYASKRSGNTKYLKRQSNKRVRRSQSSMRHGQYKRLFDYWWELF